MEEAFMNFSIGAMSNLDCWLSLIPSPLLDSSTGVRLEDPPSMALEELAMAALEIRLNIECITCTSPAIEVMAQLISSVGAIADMTDSFNDLLGYVTNILEEEFIQVQIDRILSNASQKCPSSRSYNVAYVAPQYSNAFEFITEADSADNTVLYFVSIIGAFSLLSAVIVVILRRVKQRRFAKWSQTASTEVVQALAIRQEHEKERQERLNKETISMVTSPSIPIVIRVLVPIVILGNIGLFLSGHLSLGASVDVRVEVFGESLNLANFFEFSMAKSVIDMWDAGAKELAVMIVLFSGVWPYTKQITTMVLWFAPPSWVGVSRRESILLWLDTLGKWSFVDIFVLIMSLSAFRVSINSPGALEFLQVEVYTVDMLVIPVWGLYANIIAQLLSQVSSHFIIHYHRKIKFDFEREEANTDEGDAEDREENEKQTLSNHTFGLPEAKVETELVMRKGVGIGLVLAAVGIIILFCCGCALPSLSFESFGLVGVAVELGNDSAAAITPHSLFSIIKLIIDQARFTGETRDIVGLGSLCAIFVFTVLMVPIAQICLLLWRWFAPLDRKARHRNFVAIETLMAWQYSEVFILSVVVATWQLGPLSEFMVNDYCGSLNGLFEAMNALGIVDNQDAQCFRNEASVKAGTWILLSAALGLSLLNMFIQKAAREQEEDEEMVMVNVRCEIQTPDAEKEEGEVIQRRSNYVECPMPLFSDFFPFALKSVH
mmetsp:Transcript_7570/g.11073  ORF Transcript_7570/g.11073 Transcript_7570/m.11073 type:complete len:718 (+) Transcript_7570:2-2155(+)